MPDLHGKPAVSRDLVGNMTLKSKWYEEAVREQDQVGTGNWRQAAAAEEKFDMQVDDRFVTTVSVGSLGYLLCLVIAPTM